MGGKLRCPNCAYVLTDNDLEKNEKRYKECRNFKCDVAFVEVSHEGKIILLFYQTRNNHDERKNR